MMGATKANKIGVRAAFKSHRWGSWFGAGDQRQRECIRCGYTNYAGNNVDEGDSKRVHLPWPDTKWTEELCEILVVKEVLEM